MVRHRRLDAPDPAGCYGPGDWSPSLRVSQLIPEGHGLYYTPPISLHEPLSVGDPLRQHSAAAPEGGRDPGVVPGGGEVVGGLLHSPQ